MDIQTFSDFDTFFADHAHDLRRLVADSPRATVFQTTEWQAAWWRHRGGRGRRFLALIFTKDGAVVGAGLFWRDPFTAELRLLGDGDSDYLDILADPEYENAVVHALSEWLRGDGGRYRLDIRQARPGGVLSAHRGAAAASVAGLGAERVRGEVCPVADLPATWNEYAHRLGKKRRGNIGYAERQLEKHGGRVEFGVADEATLPEDLSAFFALHQRRWNARTLPGAFAGTRARRFHEDAAQSLLAGGFLRLHTLRAGGRVAAALYCFHKGATTYYYAGGFEPTLARYSPGTVLTARAIRHAIEADGATAFDFLRGNESYKYGWGAGDVYNERILIGRRGVALRFAAAAARATIGIELGLKQRMHARFGGAGKKA